MPMSAAQQLISDLRLLGSGAAEDQPAVTDEVAFIAAPDRQHREPGYRCFGEPLSDGFPAALDCRRPAAAFGDKGAEFPGVRLGPGLHAQPLGLKMDGHRLIR